MLKLNKEFRSLYYRGKSQVHPLLITYTRKNRFGVPRIGITTGKKVGSAVARNRCRRIIREAVRQVLPEVSGGWDVVFVARTRTAFAKSTELVPVIREAFRQNGVIQ